MQKRKEKIPHQGVVQSNGTQKIQTECSVGQVLIERTESMQRQLDKHETDTSKRLDNHDVAIDTLQTRLPNWAVFLIGALMGMCGWFAARGG